MLICINMYKRFTTEDFIKKAKKVHGNKYDYSKVEYVNSRTKVCIICPEHGEFWQRANHHLQGSICPKCANNKNGTRKRFTTQEFIKKAKEVHGDKYDYSKVEYKNNFTKVCIICPEHGEFWQTPCGHIHNMQGCPNCIKSKLQNYIESFLKEEKLKFVTEKSFDWMFYKNNMKLDFYLSDYNIAIECQGGQHFIPVKKFGGENTLKETVKRDNCKYDLCIKNNTDILYIIPYAYRNNEIFQKYYKNKRKYIFVNELRKNKKRIYKLL